jgi:Fe-S-cluster-containing dehydrogenase component
MELLGDVCQMDAPFDLFGGYVNLVRDQCMVCAECTWAWESFLECPMELLGDVGQV